MSSGYRAKFVNDLQRRHVCPVCTYALRGPMQTECGHLFCRDCLEPILQSDSRCPLDGENLTRDGVFPDNACRREILQLLVYCDYQDHGCDWTGQLQKLESHTNTCSYREIKCSLCGRLIPLNLSEKHKSSDCPMKPEKCPYCSIKVPKEQLEAHIKKQCPRATHPCPNSCSPSKVYTIKELEQHLKIKGGACPLARIPCPYCDLGCSYECIRQEMDDHIVQKLVDHSQLIVDATVKSLKTVSEVTKNCQVIQERLAQSDARNSIRMSALEDKVAVMNDKRDSPDQRLSQKLSLLEERFIQLQTSFDEMQSKISSHSPTPSGYHSPPSGPGISLSHLPSSLPSAYNSALGQRVDHINTKLTEMDHTVSRCLNYNLDFDIRLQLVERATYDGTLLWKIDNFSQRRREAIEGTTLSLYSTPFYTSKQGYKMCARVYLNGDGMGKGTHLSFFFVIMKGMNDALLTWPFQQKVTLLLINQAGKKNLVDQFRPDSQSSSFQRPLKREMNIASGCPLFCRLSQLDDGFLKDDTIFLGIIVDTLGIPKPVSI